jgi:hypothetical protein
MALKPAIQLPQGRKLLYREISTLSQGSVKQRGRMPLAENKSVTLNPTGF